MAEETKPRLIDSFCGGVDKEFQQEGKCPHYEQQHNQQCRLLKRQQMEEFWEQCRRAFHILYNAVNCWSRRLKLQYPDLPIDDAEEVDFKELETRINASWRKSVLRGPPTLALWYNYVNRTIRLELKNRLRKRGILSWQENCGSCKQLSALKMCAKKEEQRKKTDSPCEHYSPKLPTVISLDGETAPDNENKKEKLLREIYEKLPETTQAETPAPVEAFAEKLTQRFGCEKQSRRKREIYERQYQIYHELLHTCFRKKNSKESPSEIRAKAVKEFAKKFGLTERHIRRDLEKIEALFKEYVREVEQSTS